MDLLIRLNDSDGNIIKMTNAEEVYTAYETGRQLALATQDTQGSLSNSPLYATVVGTFENSFLAGAPGTSGESNVAESKPQQFLYQKNLYNVDLGNANFYRPALLKTSGDLHFADDTEMNTVADRMLHVIFTNDYPGTYKLATSSPGADYTNFLSGIFNDTRSDGTSVSYNIYKRLTLTPPGDTSHKPLRRKNSSGAIQKMTDAEMRVSFGEWAKKRIIESGIGTVQLRTSGQGVPTDPGTWKSIGTATDTRQDITLDQNYTRNSQRTRTSAFAGDYLTNFTRTRASTFAGNYGLTFTRVSEGDYVGGNFLGDYTGNYTFDFVGNYTNDYTRTRITDYTANYIGNFEGNYQQDYTRDSTRDSTQNFEAFYLGFSGGVFTGNFIGNFVGNYAFNFTRTSTRDSTNIFTGNFEGNYAFDFVGEYQVEYTRNSQRTRTSNYIGNYTGDYTFDFEGNYANAFEGNYETAYIGNYLADYIGDYTGDFIADEVAATSSTIETYTLYVRTL
jgi:hypothetical protein